MSWGSELWVSQCVNITCESTQYNCTSSGAVYIKLLQYSSNKIIVSLMTSSILIIQNRYHIRVIAKPLAG